MKLLVLGGTRFLGRHVVDAALRRDHQVTVLHRGRSAPPELFRRWDLGVASVVGDRTNPEVLDALAAQHFDAVVDTSGYLPRDVALSAARLAPFIGQYLFVSSISVYASFAAPGLTEDAPRARLESADERDVAGWESWEAAPAERKFELYGALKARCEDMAYDTAGPRTLLVRPGLIVGPFDPTGRFTYWPARVARGGEILAPGRPGRAVQFIDARDLAAWMVGALERHDAGAIHANGPVDAPLTFGEVLEACVRVVAEGATAGSWPASGPPRFTWVPDEALLASGAGPWMELPLWIPESDATMAGFMAADCTRARATGLACRPLDGTVRDTLAWELERSGPPAPAGLAPERETELLAGWRRAQPAA